jgi:Hydrazine synthase alpha subunit middle domain
LTRYPILVVGALLATIASADQPAFDFETGDLQGWMVVEGQFDRMVCDRATFRNTGQPYNKQGKYYLCTIETAAYTGNDAMTGVLQSPTFVLETPRVSFLVGGGKGLGVYVALCLAQTDEEVRSARGTNDETMLRHIWDVAEFVGQKVYLKLVDQETGGWGHVTFDDFRPPTAEETAAIRADAAKPPPSPFETASRESCLAKLRSLRLAIDDLRETVGDGYTNWRDYLGRAAKLEAGIAATQRVSRTDIPERVDSLAREALAANPLVSGRPIIYVSREQYLRDHHNTETMFENGAVHGPFRGGGALKKLDLATGNVVTLLDAPQGIVRDPEVSFDGQRVIFSYRKDAADDYHIWEMNADGTGLRQITSGPNVSDIDPVYLPDGDIVFASTRDRKLCACNVHVQANLFRCEPDGSGLRQLGGNPLFEGHPWPMPDGRILYTRWEYVDKHFGPAQGLWTMNPDGTEQATYYHNNAWWPGAILDGHPVPDTDRVIATLSSCHAPPFGEIAVIDRRLGFEGERPLVKTWPQVPVTRDGYDHVWGLPLRYEDPYPLSDTVFLCSRTVRRPVSDGVNGTDQYGIYLIDLFGNEVLLHTDDQRSCFDPMPLAPRPRPPILPDRVASEGSTGLFFVYDIYVGTGMGAVPRGAARWLRVVESPPKRFISNGDWNNGARQAPAMNWSDVGNKRIIGRVPIEPDGSAYFRAPANTFLFFQLLDDRGMMIHSMRSGTMVQPGETASCIGCHDERNTAVPVGSGPRALARPPSDPEPWYGPPREFDYRAEVQPVFDRYCISCHDYGKPAGKVLNLSGDRTLIFSASYLELHRRSGTVFQLAKPDDPLPLIKVVNHGPPEVLPPYAWGSHRSKLIRTLLDGHYDVKLDAESLDRLVTWVDMNGVFYGSYQPDHPDNLGGRCPLTPAQIARLNELTGLNVADEIAASWVNLTRPELSPCLTTNLPPPAGGTAEPGKERFSGTDDPKYQEAAGIIASWRGGG